MPFRKEEDLIVGIDFGRKPSVTPHNQRILDRIKGVPANVGDGAVSEHAEGDPNAPLDDEFKP